jgi:hypothetical protein
VGKYLTKKYSTGKYSTEKYMLPSSTGIAQLASGQQGGAKCNARCNAE